MNYPSFCYNQPVFNQQKMHLFGKYCSPDWKIIFAMATPGTWQSNVRTRIGLCNLNVAVGEARKETAEHLVNQMQTGHKSMARHLEKGPPETHSLHSPFSTWSWPRETASKGSSWGKYIDICCKAKSWVINPRQKSDVRQQGRGLVFNRAHMSPDLI